MILDDVVLDIKDFLNEHPGGRFSLEHNIGRDVSKFFHGSYALETIQGVEPHFHSNDARHVVNKLVIGRLEGSYQTRIMNIQAS